MCAESRELKAFMLFAEHAALNVMSVEESEPPAPDILATIEGCQVAFEMTEALEPDFAQKLSLFYKSTPLIRSAYNEVPAELRDEIERRHRGKMIDVCFREDVLSLNQRRAALPGIFEFLARLDADVGVDAPGRLEYPNDLPALELDRLLLQAVGRDDIHWEAGAHAGWIDPEGAARERLIDKMTKKIYQSAAPVELVVYYDQEVTPPTNTGWEDALGEVATAHLENSPFRRVWLNDTWTNNVVLLAEAIDELRT